MTARLTQLGQSRTSRRIRRLPIEIATLMPSRIAAPDGARRPDISFIVGDLTSQLGNYDIYCRPAAKTGRDDYANHDEGH